MREELLKKISADAKRVKQAIEEMKEPLIIHHYDADGISAGVIVEEGVKAMGKNPRIKMYEGFSDEDAEKLKDEELILVDLGSHSIALNDVKKAVIIDHHQIKEGLEVPSVNPWLYGLDGTKEASSSTMAWMVFNIREELALVGAAGDIQTPFTGINRYVLEESGAYDIKRDLTLYGRTKPITQFLMSIYEPYIKGLTQNAGEVRRLLKRLGVKFKDEMTKKEKSYAQLNDDEKLLIRSELVKILAYVDDLDEIEAVVGEVYLIKDKYKVPKRDLREFATLLNACGRYNLEDVGRGIARGEAAAVKRGEKLLEQHSANIRRALTISRALIEEREGYLFVDGRGRIDPSIIGIVCSALQRTEGLPVIGIAKRRDMVKISMRIGDGEVNAGKLMAKLGEKYKGDGGGHVKAAGAEIKDEYVDAFLKDVEAVLKKSFIKVSPL